MYAYNAVSGLAELVNPTCNRLGEFGLPNDAATRVQLLAIAGQESGWWARKQYADGPARGLWQFERYGGVQGVFDHYMSAGMARLMCEEQFVTPTPSAAYEALQTNDMLACSFARLLLWTDPQKNPDDLQGGWAQYLRVWRPGKPRPEHWPQNHLRACAAVEDAQKGKKLQLVAIPG